MTSDKGGRPPIGRRFTLRLDDTQRARLEQLAARRRAKLADVTRTVIDAGLNEVEQENEP